MMSTQHILRLYQKGQLHYTMPLKEQRIILGKASIDRVFNSLPTSYEIELVFQAGDYVLQSVSDKNLFPKLDEVPIALPYTLQSGDIFYITDEVRIEYEREVFETIDSLASSENLGKPDVMLDIVALEQQSLAQHRQEQEPRLGCAYCFETLNPNHPTAGYNTFLQLNDKIYHQTCWDNVSSSKAEAVAITVPAPQTLNILTRQPVTAHGGPINTLQDKPMGISHGTVSFDRQWQGQYQSVILRNNSDKKMLIERHHAPSWVYIDYGHYEQISNKLTLNPNESQYVEIYPHIARPSWGETLLSFSDRQVILIVNDTFSPGFIISIAVFAIVMLWHWFAVVGWLGAPFSFLGHPEMVAITVSTGLLCGWITFMIPSQLLWFLYNTLEKIGRIRWLQRADVFQRGVLKAQEILWEQFAYRRVVELMTKPLILLGVALLTVLITSLVSILLWLLITLLAQGIYQILGGLGMLLLGIIYTGTLFFASARLLRDYDIELVDVTLRLSQAAIEQGTNLIRTRMQSS